MTNPSHAAELYDALDAEDVARVDTRQAFIRGYTTGWLAGRAEAPVEPTSLDLIADGYTAAQEARADALAAASRMLAGSPIGWGVRGVDRVLDIGRALAAWIEHGDPAPATLAEHVETAMDLVGAARDVVADAAKMAQPRARPTQT